MRLHIYKIEEDRTADRAEVYVYGAFTAAEAKAKVESIWAELAPSEQKHANVYAQGFDLDTDAIPDWVLDDLDIPRDFDPRTLSEEKLSPLLASIDESLMLPPYDIAADISCSE